MQELYRIRGILKSPIDMTGTEVIGKTIADLELNRSAEIKTWLRNHPEVTHWVAIDDLDMSTKLLMGRYGVTGLDNFVITAKSSEGLKQSGIKQKVLKFLAT
jgi:hypothetical protein